VDQRICALVADPLGAAFCAGATSA
jgi:hypothetical protein